MITDLQRRCYSVNVLAPVGRFLSRGGSAADQLSAAKPAAGSPRLSALLLLNILRSATLLIGSGKGCTMVHGGQPELLRCGL